MSKYVDERACAGVARVTWRRTEFLLSQDPAAHEWWRIALSLWLPFTVRIPRVVAPARHAIATAGAACSQVERSGSPDHTSIVHRFRTTSQPLPRGCFAGSCRDGVSAGPVMMHNMRAVVTGGLRGSGGVLGLLCEVMLRIIRPALGTSNATWRSLAYHLGGKLSGGQRGR